MDTAQWTTQGIHGVVKSMETSRSLLERPRARPQKDHALNCPRCNSTNTKFCYYNNYSLSQPRYFCKACRRYWTEGGSLRNVPVGGGSRKNRRSTSTSTTTSSRSASAATVSTTVSSPSSAKNNNVSHDLGPANFPQSASQNPRIHQGQDLNLACPPSDHEYSGISSSSAMELLKTGMTSRGLSSFFSMPVSESNSIYNTGGGFGLHDMKPTLNFSLEGFGSGYGGGLQGVQQTSAGSGGGGGGGLVFPVEDLKQVSGTPTEFDQNRGHGDSSGFWNVLGGGSW